MFKTFRWLKLNSTTQPFQLSVKGGGGQGPRLVEGSPRLHTVSSLLPLLQSHGAIPVFSSEDQLERGECHVLRPSFVIGSRLSGSKGVEGWLRGRGVTCA